MGLDVVTWSFIFQDKKGETPLSCAIAQNNLEIVKLLIDTGRCQCNIRVPESDEVSKDKILFS